MPPKKKAKSTAASTPAPDVDENAMVIDTDAPSELPKPDPLQDPWSDEQETSLFKGIIKWKPCGQSTDFLRLAFSQSVKSK